MSVLLLLLFLALPWMRLAGNPLLLLDVRHGRFSFFGLGFWASDAPMLAFVLGGAVVLLAFVTSVWGRVWCGWACPQTVFVERIFRRIERWAEGDAVARKRRDSGPWTEEKVGRKALKWTLFVMVSAVLGHAFVAYFIGAEALGRMMARPPSENAGSFAATCLISAIVLFDFGWLRERFCVSFCPYGRFQSVLLDERSWTVAYDRARGEPRGKAVSPLQASPARRGDCVDCRRCVNVCPTGIDIRNGLQLECIACTACIDACDLVMSRVGRPTGLIRYATGSGGRETAKPPGDGWSRFSPRAWAYLGVLLLWALGLATSVRARAPIERTVVRAIGAPFERIVKSGGGDEVVNRYHVDFRNREFAPVRLRLAGVDRLAKKGIELVATGLPMELAPGEIRRIELFVRLPATEFVSGKAVFSFATEAEDSAGRVIAAQSEEVPLVGPFR